jgi:ribose transport system substrate-binding protein
MRKIFFVLLTAILVLSVLSACAKTPESNKSAQSNSSQETNNESTKKLKFAYSIMIMDNPYFIAVKKGFEDRAKELGIETTVNDAKYDAATQLSQVENYLTQKFDAIAISPIDQKGIEGVVEKAREAKIVTLSEAQPIANADGNLIVNEYEYGVAIGTNAANWINEKLKGEAEVLIIAQDNVESVKQRGNGVEETIKKLAPKAKIIARQTGDTPELAMKITETVLQAHPNLKVIAATNDSGGLGAFEAVIAANKATPDFFVGGADATEQALAKMKEKDSIYRATVDIDPYGTGKKMVDMMLKYVKEGPKKETIYFDMKPILQDSLQK